MTLDVTLFARFRMVRVDFVMTLSWRRRLPFGRRALVAHQSARASRFGGIVLFILARFQRLLLGCLCVVVEQSL